MKVALQSARQYTCLEASRESATYRQERSKKDLFQQEMGFSVSGVGIFIHFVTSSSSRYAWSSNSTQVVFIRTIS